MLVAETKAYVIPTDEEFHRVPDKAVSLSSCRHLFVHNQGTKAMVYGPESYYTGLSDSLWCWLL